MRHPRDIRLQSRNASRWQPGTERIQDRFPHVHVLNVHTGIAVGRIAAPALARSQAAGAVIQGIGYALYEAREVDSRTGDILSGGMEDYRIPGIADMPAIDVHFDEGGFDHVLGGSVGIGEVATVPTSPAIANAIHNATGIRLTELPIRPDRLVAALKGSAAAWLRKLRPVARGNSSSTWFRVASIRTA